MKDSGFKKYLLVAGIFIICSTLLMDLVLHTPFHIGPLKILLLAIGFIVVALSQLDFSKFTNEQTLLKIQAPAHVISGVSLVLVGIWIDSLGGSSGVPYLFYLGGILFFTSAFVRTKGLKKSSTIVCMLFLIFLVFWMTSEAVFRFIKFDFHAGQEWDWDKLPPIYRQPTLPHDTVFFRRKGPETWKGKVRDAGLRQNVGERLYSTLDNPYTNEPPVEIRYNSLGFRKPEGMDTWEIAVTGDGFTELGYLKDEDLFTSILARNLKINVANFGVAYSGPLTELSYLKSFGISKSTRHTVVIFYEGNDISDLEEENTNLEKLKKNGRRPVREYTAQTSLTRAILAKIGQVQEKISNPSSPTSETITGYFSTHKGKIPVTLNYAPPGSAELATTTVHQIEDFLEEYSGFAREKGVTPWLAYMPSKERALYGEIEFIQGTKDTLRNWKPTDLPELIQKLCEKHGVKFINLAIPLIARTREKKELLYNSLFDTHLNEAGSRLVGEELTKVFSNEFKTNPIKPQAGKD